MLKRCPCGITGTPGKPACKKDHGTWSWRADAGRDPETGRRRQASGSGYRTKPDAETALAAYVAAFDAGTVIDDKRTTVGEWLDSWLEACAARLEPKTVAGYRSHIRMYLSPMLGHIRLRALRRDHVAALLRELATPAAAAAPTRRKPGVRRGRGGRTVAWRSAGTVDGVRRTLRAALTAAKEAGLVATNVAEGNFTTGGRETSAMRYWQPDDLARFLDTVKGDRLEALYEVAAFTGMRRGELLGLRWTDLDGDGHGVTVQRSLSGLAGAHPCEVCGGTHRGRRFKSPKTDRGFRWVPLVGSAATALQQHRAAQAAERERWGDAYADHGLIFAAENGEPLRPDAITKDFDARADAAGLQRIRLHDLRHGAASLMLAAGMPVETAAKILGHSEAVLRRTYAHIVREPSRSGAEAAAALVRPSAGRAQLVHIPAASDADRSEVTAMT